MIRGPLTRRSCMQSNNITVLYTVLSIIPTSTNVSSVYLFYSFYLSSEYWVRVYEIVHAYRYRLLQGNKTRLGNESIGCFCYVIKGCALWQHSLRSQLYPTSMYVLNDWSFIPHPLLSLAPQPLASSIILYRFSMAPLSLLAFAPLIAISSRHRYQTQSP